MDCIVNQMMAVAEYLGWDASELKPVRKDQARYKGYMKRGRGMKAAVRDRVLYIAIAAAPDAGNAKEGGGSHRKRHAARCIKKRKKEERNGRWRDKRVELFNTKRGFSRTDPARDDDGN